MDHSAFDSYAFSLESSDKKILYSGDFREHGRKSKAFYWFLHNAPKGVDALLLEGSLLGGRESVQIKEDAVEESILRAVKDSVGIVFFIASGQNIDRLVSFYKASLRSKRLFVIDLYTAAILDGLKDFAKLPYPSKDFRNIRVLIPARLINLLKRRGNTDLLRKFSRFAISKEEISQNVQGIVMILRQSIINELARLQGIDGATVIYSLWEGYLNEPSMNKLIRFIKEKDMTMIHLHTSGHATLDTLKKVAHRLKPKAIIPIHTYHPDQYESLFPNVIKVSDGVEIHI
jgi:ribonuclease J